MITNGYKQRPEGREEVAVLSPVTGDVVGAIWMAEEQDADLILDTANKGFKRWSVKTIIDRAEMILRFADLIDQNEQKLAAMLTRERGKTLNESLGEVRLAAVASRGFAEMSKHLYGHTFPQSQRGIEEDLIFTRFEPIGVFLCIIPYNNPLHLCIQKIIPALLMGNTVIVKPPTEDPLALIEILGLLLESGVPEECASIACGHRDFVMEKLIKSDRIHAVSLTGGEKAGINVYTSAAEKLHRVFMELGGNDPLVILPDADIPYAASEIVKSRLANGGQSCSSSKRIIVHESICDQLLKELMSRVNTLKRGDLFDPETQLSYSISVRHADEVIEQIKHTIEQGAKCVLGGTKSEPAFVEPTILVDVTKDMDVAKDMEIFGPVIPLICYQTEMEAIEIANQTSYGLEGGIISGDLKKAFAIAQQIQCGAIMVNGASNYRHVDMPFGGEKASGIGREGISVTLKEFSNEKSYVVKGAFPLLK